MLEAVLGVVAESVLALALEPEAMVDDDPAFQSGAEDRPEVVLHMVPAGAPVVQVADMGSSTAGMEHIQDIADSTVDIVATALQSSQH